MKRIQFNNRTFIIFFQSKWNIEHISIVRKVLKIFLFRKKGISIQLSNDLSIQKLNFRWRGINRPTNVLSFPSFSSLGESKNYFNYLGDIIISYDTLKKEASKFKIPFETHFCHILVHGILHLLGYSHNLQKEENTMKKEEIRILNMLKIDTKYLKRSL